MHLALQAKQSVRWQVAKIHAQSHSPTEGPESGFLGSPGQPAPVSTLAGLKQLHQNVYTSAAVILLMAVLV